MEIRGPNNSSRPNLDPTSDSRKAERLKQSQGGGKSPESSSDGDSLEVSASRLIEQSVEEVLGQLERRVTDVSGRKEELLLLADDPAAVRRAARGILASGNSSAGDSVNSA